MLWIVLTNQEKPAMQPETQTNQAYRAVAREIASPQQKVLRNTYLLLAFTMVPTVIGAMIGINTAAIIIRNPIVSFFVMLGAVIGLQYAIAANRNSGWGIVFLLGMTFLLGWFLGPLLSFALAFKNGPQLIGFAAGGTRVVLFVISPL